MRWIILALSLYCSSLFAQNRGEMIRIMKGNYYQALGVSSSASKAEIKTAYRQLAKVYHPDKQMNPANAKAAGEIMQRINEVYETLSDDLRRKAYNITQNVTEAVKPKAAAAATEAWEKWNFAEFKKPEAPATKKAEPSVNAKPEPSVQAKTEPKAPPKPEPTVQATTSEPKVRPAVEPLSEAKKPTPLMAKKAQQIYGEVNRCGSDFSKSIIDEFY